jgi:hypothetical protein
MKTVIVFSLAFLFFSANVEAQFSYWYSTNGIDIPYALDMDQHEGYIIAGNVIYGGVIGPNPSYATMTRVTSNGTPLWSKTYHLGGNDEFFNGVTAAPLPTLEQFAAVGRTNYPPNTDTYLVITNTSGNVVNARRFGTAAADFGQHIEAYHSPELGRGYIIAGYTENGSVGAPDKDIHIVRTNASGILVASALFPKPNDQYVSGITPTRDNGFVFVAQTKTATGCEIDTHKILVVKLDGHLDVVWVRLFDLTPLNGYSNDYPVAVREDANQDLHIAGGSSVYINNVYDHSEAFQLHLDANGAVLWAKSYTSPSSPSISARSMINNINMGSGLPGYALLGRLDGEALLFKTNSSGNVVWAKTYPSNNGEGPTYPEDITRNSLKGVSFTGVSYPSSAGSNIHLVETDGNGSTGGACENPVTITYYKSGVCSPKFSLPQKTTLQEIPAVPWEESLDPVQFSCKEEASSMLNVSPNPAGNTITISGVSQGEVLIFDLQGMIMKRTVYTENGAIDIADLPEGLYVLKVIDSRDGVKEFRFIKR